MVYDYRQQLTHQLTGIPKLFPLLFWVILSHILPTVFSVSFFELIVSHVLSLVFFISSGFFVFSPILSSIFRVVRLPIGYVLNAFLSVFPILLLRILLVAVFTHSLKTVFPRLVLMKLR